MRFFCNIFTHDLSLVSCILHYNKLTILQQKCILLIFIGIKSTIMISSDAPVGLKANLEDLLWDFSTSETSNYSENNSNIHSRNIASYLFRYQQPSYVCKNSIISDNRWNIHKMGGGRHGQNIAQCWPSVLIGDNPYFNQSNVPMFLYAKVKGE